MFRIAFALWAVLQSNAQPQSGQQDEIRNALTHAEALYYNALFTESIALLNRIDEVLKSTPGRVQDKVDTKLRLALAHIGLNENTKAKALLTELYLLDSDYALDARQFSPKVIAVANEAKAEQTKIQCYGAQTDARMYLEGGRSAEFTKLLRSLKSKCPALTAMEPEAADTFYKNGLTAYKRNELSNALTSFNATLALSPQHELAQQYVDLIQSKQQLSDDRLLLQWQRNFDSRQLKPAAADYRQLMASNDNRGKAGLTHATGEYRKALQTLVENWNRTCAAGDRAGLNAIRSQITELLPDPSFGEDIRARMNECPEPKKTESPLAVGQLQPGSNAAITNAVSPVNNAGGCFEMQSQLALTRLKTRVDPVVTNEIRAYLKNNTQIQVRVKARIGENGDVTVTGMQDGNPMLNNVIRAAVTEWKFLPIRDQSGPRCVDTEIPILIKLSK